MVKKKTKAQAKDKGRPKHHPHRCGERCRHTCGEAGGRNRYGGPCTRVGGWGVSDVVNGHRLLCRDHDPNHNGSAPSIEHALNGLTGKRALFVIEYCGRANANATEAASLAKYGGNRVTLQVTGSQLMHDPKVKAAINARFEELSAPGEEILKRITEDARLDIRPLIEFRDGEPYVKLTEEVLERYGTLIKEIEIGSSGKVIRVKLNDSQAARRDLAKIRRLYTDSPIINIIQQLPDDELEAQMEVLRQRLHGGRGRFEVVVNSGKGGK